MTAAVAFTLFHYGRAVCWDKIRKRIDVPYAHAIKKTTGLKKKNGANPTGEYVCWNKINSSERHGRPELTQASLR